MKTWIFSTLAWTAILAAPALYGQTKPAVRTLPPTEWTPFPGTELLTQSGDLASNLVAGVDRFLLGKTAASIAGRARFWNRDLSSPANYERSVETNRLRLARILGVRDARPTPASLHAIHADAEAKPLIEGAGIRVHRVRWKATGLIEAEGLLLQPSGAQARPIAQLVVLPDADVHPEQIAGLMPGLAPEAQYARRLAQSGCRVLIPTLINRRAGQPKSEDNPRGANLSNREFLYRPAFELGRHLIGYEIQKVLAAVDWFRQAPADASAPIGVWGWGEGGLIAFYAGALDRRIQAVGVSGYFGARETTWQEPIERNVFGLLEAFGDAEVASLIAPRHLIVEASAVPRASVPTGTSGGPGQLTTPTLSQVRNEWARALQLTDGLPGGAKGALLVSGEGSGPNGTDPALQSFLSALKPDAVLIPDGPALPPLTSYDPEPRHREQLRQIDRETQVVLTESPFTRQKFMAGLDTKSLENFNRTVESYRDFFARDVIGRFDDPMLPARPRTRKAYEAEKWTGYEVVLDVFPDVIAYGILLVPKDLAAGESRPVVVCQHGLEGRPQHVIMDDHAAYHDFAGKLAERGFITFSPQNLYIFTDRFRTLQRKANPIGKTLFSVIVPQHQQIVDWLKTLPFVDPKRIAFYGLSYGGKTAMRVPPLVKDYCLSICSADFNEWVWKNASTRSPYSYVWSGEYEIFEFDLGSTFNYAEMAALIAPRPFMVERGHFDGVAPDETVAYEFGKVRFLYAARLGLADRCEIEWFVGPHTINGKAAYDFLHRHLNWPRR